MRGGITVFLSLILTCICALLGGLFESARAAGCGWYMQMAINSSLDSLMSRYHRGVWDQYRLFLLDSDEEAALREGLEPYCEAYLEAAPFYPLSDQELEVRVLARMTDGGGAYFEKEVLDYMKLGIWNMETDPEALQKTAEDLREAEGLYQVADRYQENGKKILRLEESIEAIGGCLKRQEEYLDKGNRELENGNGSAFLKTAGKLLDELDRIPGLVEAYGKKADELALELAKAEQSKAAIRPDLKEDSRMITEAEAAGYRSYLDKDGERRREVEKTRETAEQNRKVVEEAIREAEEIQEYIEDWEPQDEDDELDEEALWRRVLRITGRFQTDARFREAEIRDKKTMGILETVGRLAQTNLVSLCVPEGTVISQASLPAAELPSRLAGNGDPAGGRENLLVRGLERALLNEYAVSYFASFCKKAEKPFCYEQEYLLQGKDSDRENLEQTLRQLIAVREALNLVTLYGSQTLRSQAEALAFSITGAVGLAPLTTVVSFFIMTVWAFAESVEDVRILLAGGRVPFLKTADEWRVSLSGLAEQGAAVWKTVQREDGAQQEGRGSDYQGWLRMFYLMEDKTTLCYRMMDLIQNTIAIRQPSFRMERCAVSLEASLSGRGTLVPVARTARRAY